MNKSYEPIYFGQTLEGEILRIPKEETIGYYESNNRYPHGLIDGIFKQATDIEQEKLIIKGFLNRKSFLEGREYRSGYLDVKWKVEYTDGSTEKFRDYTSEQMLTALSINEWAKVKTNNSEVIVCEV